MQYSILNDLLAQASNRYAELVRDELVPSIGRLPWRTKCVTDGALETSDKFDTSSHEHAGVVDWRPLIDIRKLDDDFDAIANSHAAAILTQAKGAIVTALAKCKPGDIAVVWSSPDEFNFAASLLRRAKRWLVQGSREHVLCVPPTFVEKALLGTVIDSADYKTFRAIADGTLEGKQAFGFTWDVQPNVEQMFAFARNELRLSYSDLLSYVTLTDSGSSPIAFVSHLDMLVEINKPLQNAVRLVL